MTEHETRTIQNSLEIIRGLPKYSLGFLAINSSDLSDSRQKDFIDCSKPWKIEVIDNAGRENPIRQASYDAYSEAGRLWNSGNSTPLIAFVIVPERMRKIDYRLNKVNIDMGRIVNVLDVKGLTPNEAVEQMYQLVEDNFGRAQMLIRHFAEYPEIS